MEVGLLIGFGAIVVILMVIGVPIYISFLAGSAFYVIFDPRLHFATVAQMLLSGLDKWSLIAIPFYVLAGLLLAYGGAAKYLVDFMDEMVGHIRGGMQIAAVLACMFFSAMSGSGPATTVAIGAVMLGPMVALGYKKENAMGAIATTGTLGNIIPPSIAFVVIGSLVSQDVGKLFVGGIIPGLVIGGCIAVTAYIMARKENYKMRSPSGWAEKGRALVKGIPALMMPVIILGGIYGGIFTPTEAAGVACLWSVIASLIYREFSWAKTRTALLDAMKTTTRLFLLIGSAMVFGLILTYNGIPQMVTQLVSDAGLPLLGYMGLCLILYLVLGMLLDAAPIVIITLPVIWPAAMAVGADPIHFVIFMTGAVVAGQATPPYGINLFAMAGLTQEPVGNVIRGAIPFIIALYVGLVIIMLIPFLSTWLPSFMH
ncbi:MAG: TRAP transporter large permease [Thermodesulfobacteriota bacterium]|nr:TRAP transporter large permease [Thermodesulfobacteriota bacterium]